MAKKTILEQIKDFEATRAAKAARLNELMEAAAEKGETLDAQGQEEYDTIEGELKQIDAHLRRLETLQKANVAAAKPVAGMILESPFTSAADVAAVPYWFVPVRLLMKDQFRSDLQIGKVTAPVLVLHGDRDNIVPIALGERLYAMINAPKRFVRLAGGGHNDLGARAIEAAQRFLGERLR